MTKRGIRVLSCNGHLGFGKTREESFRAGLDYGVDYLVADAGSCDIGPGPLGSDGWVSPTEWVRHDLELMVLAARERGLPMIIGSAGDAGSKAGVDRFVGIIQDVAAEHDLPPFTIGYFYSDIEPARLATAIRTPRPGTDEWTALHAGHRRPLPNRRDPDRQPRDDAGPQCDEVHDPSPALRRKSGGR